jgi:hypothetical protein
LLKHSIRKSVEFYRAASPEAAFSLQTGGPKMSAVEAYQHDDDDDDREEGCDCNYSMEYGDIRHEPDCALSPDLNDGWLYYPCDGEVEGGVYVHPTHREDIYLLVKSYLVPVSLSTAPPGTEPTDVRQTEAVRAKIDAAMAEIEAVQAEIDARLARTPNNGSVFS